MQLFVAVCGIISAGLAIYCGIPYILTIVRGQTKPHQFTWLIFTIMNCIIVLSQYLAGARASLLVSVVFLIYTAIDFVLALKYGVRDSSKYDRVLLALALLTIVAWALTRNNAIAIWLTVLIDVFATTMLILKLRAHPGSEPLYLWLIAASSFIFSCLSLANKPFGILYVRPIYGFLSDFAVVAAIWYFRPKGKSRVRPKPDFPEV